MSRRLRTAPFLVVSLFFASSLLHAQALTNCGSPRDISAAYPNSTDGLTRLLHQLLRAAKSNDRAALHSQIVALEIPSSNADFEQRIIQLAQQDGELTVIGIDTSNRDVLHARINQYVAGWENPAAPNPEDIQNIGWFSFTEGRFRLDTAAPVSPEDGASGLVPAKPLHLVAPDYPRAAAKKSVQGTVVLNVILRKDGSVAVENVAQGDRLLSAAAVKAVRQWRYQPYLFNNRPVQAHTKIDVHFRLSQ